MPSTPRVVQAAPGPTPTSTAAAPVPHQVQAGVVLAQPPTATGIGSSRMNSLRLSGGRSSSVETCSAEITVPWMTRTSSPASNARS